MKFTAICTHSTSLQFKAGNDYQITASSKDAEKGSAKAYRLTNVGGGVWECRSTKGVIAQFNCAEAKPEKKKSIMKMLVRAFKKYAISNGWNDSKKSKFSNCWREIGCSSLNDWARSMAFSYDPEYIIQCANEDGDTVNQDYLDEYAETEMSYY